MEHSDLSAQAREKIGPLARRVIRRANGALPYDYIVPNGVYEELWDWDAFFVGLHLISVDRAAGIYLKNWCLNFLRHTEPDGHTPGGIRPWSGRDARLYHIKPLMAQAAFYASLALDEWEWLGPVWETMSSAVTYRERKNGMMHENYHAETGEPLAAPDFISWNLLVVQMIDEAREGAFKPDPERTLWAV